MKVKVSRTKIDKKEENRVSSHLIFEPHRRRNLDSLKFHEEGIFSKKIFGNINKCDCGEFKDPGFCETCGTRIISSENIPDFYIDLETKVLASFPNIYKLYVILRKKVSEEDIKDILSYKKIIIVNESSFEVIESENSSDIEDIQDKDFYIGYKAIEKIFSLVWEGYTEEKVSEELVNLKEWMEEYLVDYILIPHTIYRPIVIDGGNNPLITGINNLYSDIVRNINNAIEMKEYAKNDLYLLFQYRTITRIYNDIIEKLFDELQNVKYSILKSEIISHPISGAVRAVLINRHDLNEDVILIGDTLVETLWPFLFKKHYGDMAKINKELVDKNYKVLLNRPPTISHLSTIALKPRISSCYPLFNIENTNGGLKHNEDYIRNNRHKIGIFNDKDGDIEKFGSKEIDTLGLRCISINPIVTDGMAADFDGDTLLTIALYGDSSLKQAEELLPSKSYMNFANGEIRNKIIEDFIYADED